MKKVNNNITTATDDITIDLDSACKWPSDALLKVYTDADAMQLFTDFEIMRSEYQNNKRIWQSAKGSGNPVRHSITACYRRKVGKNEYLFLYDSISTKDYFGNNIMHFVDTIGRWTKPHIARTYGINPASIRNTVSPENMKPTGSEPFIDGQSVTYDYPWEQALPSLIAFEKAGLLSPDCRFYAWAEGSGGNTKYGVSRWIDFISLPFEDLELLGKAGKRFDSIYEPGSTESVDKIRKIVKAEIEKGINL